MELDFRSTAEVVSFGQWESETSWDDETTSNVIAFYDENLGLMPLDGYAFNWTAPNEVVLSSVNAVNPTFEIPCDDPLVGETLDLTVIDINDNFESKSVSVSVSIVENEAPVAVIGVEFIMRVI